MIFNGRLPQMSKNNEEIQKPVITTILLSYNREHLLRKTVNSYLSTISVPYKLIIVDNASKDGSKEFIEKTCHCNAHVQGIFLTENIGGKAFELGTMLYDSPFIHFTENDIEYLVGWDKELLEKFQVFPELGQLSVFSPFPQSKKGEIWEIHPSKPLQRNGKTIYIADRNIATTSIVRREAKKGVRWGTRPISHETYRFPTDYMFSMKIKKKGFWVAWNDKYTVNNLGHSIEEWKNNLNYYIENYKAKPVKGITGMRKMLQDNGYDIVIKNNESKIINLENKT